jgi:mRNA interferase MazF
VVKQIIQRFDIWLVQLDPTQGSEIKKTRPCVILSPNEMSSLKTAIVAPMTSKGFSFPTRIECTFRKKQGLILLDQIRALDKSRLIQKLGKLPRDTQVKIVNCLQELFSF